MATSDKPVTIIDARPETVRARLAEVWAYRTFYPMLLHEISMRKFRGTLFGFWWLIIRPLVPTALAVIAFTFIAKMESYGLPYAVFYLTGFLSWHAFHATVIFMPRTFLWMQGMMRKTYFPKLLVPFASVGPPLIEVGVVVALFVLSLVFFYMNDGVLYIDVSWRLLLVPLVMLMSMLLGMAIGMVASTVALFLRDIVFSMNYFAQLFMFLTPVIYPITFVPERLRWIVYVFNPMAKQVETMRWAITGLGEFDAAWLLVSCATILTVFALAIAFVLRAETQLSDAI